MIPVSYTHLGRTHKSVNAVYSDRVIDIDLLLCFADDGTPVLLDTPELKLPHPLMQERRFVMEPLAEIASGVEMCIRDRLQSFHCLHRNQAAFRLCQFGQHRQNRETD